MTWFIIQSSIFERSAVGNKPRHTMHCNYHPPVRKLAPMPADPSTRVLTDATTAPPDAIPPTCYICYDPDATTPANPLLRSPCNACNLYVHRACLDQHLIQAAVKERCVLMRVDQDGVPVSDHNGPPTQHVVYASCTVCKRRFEYRSKVLVKTLKGMNAYVRSLAAQILTMEETQAAEAREGEEAQATPTSVATDVVAVFDGVTDNMARARMHQFLEEAMQHMRPAEFGAELTRALHYLRYASAVGVGCVAVLVGLTLRALCKW